MAEFVLTVFNEDVVPVFAELHDTVKVMDGQVPDLPDTVPVTSYDVSAFFSSFFSTFTREAITEPSACLRPLTFACAPAVIPEQPCPSNCVDAVAFTRRLPIRNVMAGQTPAMSPMPPSVSKSSSLGFV